MASSRISYNPTQVFLYFPVQVIINAGARYIEPVLEVIRCVEDVFKNTGQFLRISAPIMSREPRLDRGYA